VNRPPSNITSKYEEERIRAADQSQFVHLQSQIDELRRLLKDQTNRYQLITEQTRKTESALAQMQGLIDDHREEITLTVERTRRDIAELRRDMAAARMQVDEVTSPIREMIAQIQQLADARKQDREYVSTFLVRIDALEQTHQGLHNQIKAMEDNYRQLALQLDRLRDADTIALQDIRRLSEEAQVERQQVRRQIMDTAQLFEGKDEEVKALTHRLDRLDDLQQRFDLTVATFTEQITSLNSEVAVYDREIKRVEQIANDWFMLNQERLEELRQQSNEKLDELRDIDQNHLQQLTAWLERLDSLLRELEQRQGRSVHRIEQDLQQHILRIRALEQRKLTYVKALAEVFSRQAEIVIEETERSRRDDHGSS
jgi:chromosome segregation ATPase